MGEDVAKTRPLATWPSFCGIDVGVFFVYTKKRYGKDTARRVNRKETL
jgi:hypothetical protein